MSERLMREWMRGVLSEVGLPYQQMNRRPGRFGTYLNKIQKGSVPNPETGRPWNEFELEDGGTVTIPLAGNAALVNALKSQSEDDWKSAWSAGVETSIGKIKASGAIKKTKEFGGGTGRGETARARGLRYEADLSSLLQTLGSTVRQISVPAPAGGDAGDDLQIMFGPEKRISIEAKTDIAADFGSFTLLYAFPSNDGAANGTWQVSQTKHFTQRKGLLGGVGDRLVAKMNALAWDVTFDEAQKSPDYIVKKTKGGSYLRGFVTNSPPYNTFKKLFSATGRLREKVPSTTIQDYYGSLKGNSFVQVGGKGLYYLKAGMPASIAEDILGVPEFAASFAEPDAAVSYVVNFKDGRIRVEAKAGRLNRSSVSLGDPEMVLRPGNQLNINDPLDRVIIGFALYAAGDEVTDETIEAAVKEAQQTTGATMPESLLREVVRHVLSEELTKTDKKEIEKIARKQAKSEIEKVVGKSLDKTIQKEVEKTLKGKATKAELANITKAVVKKLYRDLAVTYPNVIDRIKV